MSNVCNNATAILTICGNIINTESKIYEICLNSIIENNTHIEQIQGISFTFEVNTAFLKESSELCIEIYERNIENMSVQVGYIKFSCEGSDSLNHIQFRDITLMS